MTRQILRVLLGLLVIGWFNSSMAAINLLLTQGVDKPIPVAIVPFAGQAEQNDKSNIANVVTADLTHSGRFQPLDVAQMSAQPHEANQVVLDEWRKQGVDAVAVGRVTPTGNGKYHVEFALTDILSTQSSNTTPTVLLQQSYDVNAADLRRLSHHISDLIYEKLTGEKGIFSTRIAYVLKQPTESGKIRYFLQVADADGFNPRAIFSSPEPIMSPAWASNGKQIAYVSFENKRSQIYVADIATGSRKLISDLQGINGAPSWSPDDSKIALVLSKGPNTKIFILNLASGSLQQVTDGPSIDTEPVWAPDGRSLYFTSDRGGSPQIYQITLADKHIQRVTFVGEYNASASITPNGKRIVMLNRQDGMYNIAIQDLQSGNVQTLTSSGRDESPSIAPNGSMVIYGSELGVLGLVTTDGRVKLRLPAPEGKIQEPAWSPYT